MGQHGGPEARARTADLLLETMKLRDSDVVVDVGSGDGYYSSRFAEHCKKVVAVDAACAVFTSPYYSRGNIETLCHDACTWVKTARWDDVTHVFFSISFHDLDCQDEILSTLAQGLPVGARLDMIEFHPETPYGPPKSIRFSRQQLKALVESYGFEEKAYLDLDTHYYVSFERTRLA